MKKRDGLGDSPDQGDGRRDECSSREMYRGQGILQVSGEMSMGKGIIRICKESAKQNGNLLMLQNVVDLTNCSGGDRRNLQRFS